MPVDAFDPVLMDEEKAFFTFRPRPNRPERYDEQSAFVDSEDRGVSFIVGGNGSGTSMAAACKLSRFVLFKQPPPRFDTPFWVIGPDYEQTIESFWKEKLYGWGFIPEYEIDWERVTWHDKRRALPKTVPLLPWVDGDPNCNWTLEFRSSEQGRMAMQAREIGGFCLTEQFPWEILVEILRGMRADNVPGSKFAEFTPIDPVLSKPLQDMMEQNKLPPGWRVYRANTRCNVEDPKSVVTEEWYEEFFGMVGDEMRATREIGAWATYKGLMYKSFNPKVHVFPNERMSEWPIPPNAIHKRCIDWGTGPHNAFVVLWYAVHDGKYYFYDEYYTTESNTHEERLREVHRKDGWDLKCVEYTPQTRFEIKPLTNGSTRPRWRYDMSTFQQTYGPPDDPGMFRECEKYCLPVARMSLGPNSYHPSVEAVQALLKFTPESFEAKIEPRLFISKRCENLIRELSMMRWMVPPIHAVNPRDPKPMEVQKDNHAPSALRGGVWSDMKGSGTGISGMKIELPSRPSIQHRR